MCLQGLKVLGMIPEFAAPVVAPEEEEGDTQEKVVCKEETEDGQGIKDQDNDQDQDKDKDKEERREDEQVGAEVDEQAESAVMEE